MALTSNVETMDLEEAESKGTTPTWMHSGSVDGSGAVDYRGRYADKSKTGGWKAGFFINVLLTGDAAAIIGIAGNLVPYLLNSLHMPYAKAGNTASNFMGMAYLFPVIWGYLADTYFGNYATIGGSSIICFSGLLVLFLSTTLPSLKPGECVPQEGITCPEASGNVMSWFMTGLYLTAIGAAGLLPCGTSMGQDQFDETDEVEKKRGSHFFTSFYANFNFTALFCVTILFYIQDNKGYDWGYGVITGIYFIVVACFFLATPLYRHRHPGGSALTRVGQVFVASFTNMTKRLPEDPSDLYELDDEEATKRGIRQIVHTDKLRFLDKAAIVPPENTLGPEDTGKMRRKLLCTVTQIEELKTVIQILPIWLCCISVYTVFAQLMGVTLAQALSLDRRMGSLTIPPGTTVSVLMITAICAILVYELLIVPTLRKLTGHPQGMSDLKRMGVALFISIGAMISAAVVEHRRVKVIAENHLTITDIAAGVVIPMKIYWLFPQYSLLGIVEFLLGVAQLKFFYSETPDSMRGLATSLYFTSVSIGFFISSILVDTVNKYTERTGGWLREDIVTGGLKKYYILLAAIMVVNWLMFLLFSHWYTYKKVIVDKAYTTSWNTPHSEDNSKQRKEMQLEVQGDATGDVPTATPDAMKDENSNDNTFRFSMKEASAVALSLNNTGDYTTVGTKSGHHVEPSEQPKMD